MTFDIQVWSEGRIVSEWDYTPSENQMETLESIMELFDCLEYPGDGFTIIVNRRT